MELAVASFIGAHFLLSLFLEIPEISNLMGKNRSTDEDKIPTCSQDLFCLNKQKAICSTQDWSQINLWQCLFFSHQLLKSWLMWKVTAPLFSQFKKNAYFQATLSHAYHYITSTCLVCTKCTCEIVCTFAPALQCYQLQQRLAHFTWLHSMQDIHGHPSFYTLGRWGGIIWPNLQLPHQHDNGGHSSGVGRTVVWQVEDCWFDTQVYLTKCRGFPEQETPTTPDKLDFALHVWYHPVYECEAIL